MSLLSKKMLPRRKIIKAEIEEDSVFYDVFSTLGKKLTQRCSSGML